MNRTGTPRVLLALDAVEFAGAERYVEVLLEGLAGAGSRCMVVLPRHAEPQLAQRLGARAEVVLVDGLGRTPRPAAALALRHHVQTFRPDIIHINLTDQGDGLVLIAGTAGLRPLVATLHNAIPGRQFWREQISRRVLRRADVVLSVSGAVAQYVRRIGGRATVVPNGLPPAVPVPHPRATLGLGSGPVVGGVGRLNPQKGWEVLGAVAGRLRADRPDLRVVVLGEGAERDRLSQPDCAGLELLGARPDAAGLMGAFDVLVAPSRFEAFGLVALEAMHAGVPVVASEVGGLPEVLGDTGVLVPPGDADALERAVADLLDDPVRRQSLGGRGAARARVLFTPEAMVEGVLRTYDDVQRRP